MSHSNRLRIGTRASALAHWQANWVRQQLEERGQRVELVSITTAGDGQQNTPIERIGGQGVFTKELQRALLDGRIDIAVHSSKDMATANPEGLVITAFLEREDVFLELAM